MINKDLLSQLINSIEAIKPINSVELIASKESLNMIRQSGFPLEDYKYHETPHVESTIYVVPTQSKPIKVCFVDEYEKEF